ncbi:MAG: ABC transporter transmembrane domain-containing protein, partial [Bacillota bacterium]|nr:ABC transporter transmembrane domain-containing protein [Bacillota bacterium]
MLHYLSHNKLLLVVTLVLGAITSVASVFISLNLQQLIDIAIAGNFSAFFEILIFTAIYMAVLCVLSYISALLGKRLLRNITLSMRQDVFDGVMRRTPLDFYKVNTADYLSALTNDIKMVEEGYLLPLLSIVDFSVMFLATLGLLIYLSPVVTLCLLVGLVIMLLVPALLGKVLSRRQEKVSQRMAVFTAKA